MRAELYRRADTPIPGRRARRQALCGRQGWMIAVPAAGGAVVQRIPMPSPGSAGCTEREPGNSQPLVY